MPGDRVGTITRVGRDRRRATLRLDAPLASGEKVLVQRGEGTQGTFAFQAARMRRAGRLVAKGKPGEEVSVVVPDIVEEGDLLRRPEPGPAHQLARLLGWLRA